MKMNNILLISEDYVKSNSTVNDNLFGKTLLPSIREAQEMGLQPIIGETLYRTLLDKVVDGSLKTDDDYRMLLEDYIQPYLLYQTITNMIPLTNFKNANIGTVVSNDEHVQNMSQGNIDLVGNHFQIRADFYCRRMQEYLLNNKDLYDLDECTCNGIKANLNSAASTGLWLGGFRGKRLS